MPSDRHTTGHHSTEELLALLASIRALQTDNSLVMIGMNHRSVALIAQLSLSDPAVIPAVLRRVWDEFVADPALPDVADVVLVGYGCADDVQAAIDAATAALKQEGIAISAALRVTDGRFWHLDRPDTQGTPFNPDAVQAKVPIVGLDRIGVLAATTAALQFLQQLLKDTDTDNAETTAAGDERGSALDTPAGQVVQHLARAYLTLAEDSYRTRQPVDDIRVAIITVLLGLRPLRDVAARRIDGEPWQIEMWTDLARRAAPRFAAAPTMLLALAAMQAGNMTLAGRAFSALASEALGGLLDADTAGDDETDAGRGSHGNRL